MKQSLPNLATKPWLSVVIPAYNEVENFQRGVLRAVLAYLVKAKFSWEVILVDDGSTDQTLKLLADFCSKNLGFRLIKKLHGGKLSAIQTGVFDSKGEIILFTDFDQSTPISEFEKFLPHFKDDADIVIGSRLSSGAKRFNDPILRYLRSRVLNFLIKLVLFWGISDTQCGFKAARAQVLLNLFKNLKITKLKKPKGGFMGPFDIELLFLAKKFNYKIAEVPVVWQYFPSKRLSVISEPVSFLIDILKIRFFDILGKYASS